LGKSVSRALGGSLCDRIFAPPQPDMSFPEIIICLPASDYAVTVRVSQGLENGKLLREWMKGKMDDVEYETRTGQS